MEGQKIVKPYHCHYCNDRRNTLEEMEKHFLGVHGLLNPFKWVETEDVMVPIVSVAPTAMLSSNEGSIEINTSQLLEIVDTMASTTPMRPMSPMATTTQGTTTAPMTPMAPTEPMTPITPTTPKTPMAPIVATTPTGTIESIAPMNMENVDKPYQCHKCNDQKGTLEEIEKHLVGTHGVCDTPKNLMAPTAPKSAMVPTASSNSLPWPNWNQVSDGTRSILYQIYKNQGFCFETRLQLSDFLQHNFALAEPGKILACKLATQLLQEMESYIKSRPKTSAFVTIKSTMRQTLKNLQEKHSSTDEDKLNLYRIVHTSLMQEKELVYKVSTLKNVGCVMKFLAKVFKVPNLFMPLNILKSVKFVQTKPKHLDGFSQMGV